MLRTMTVLTIALALPGVAAAQEHKCACCAKMAAGHDHTAQAPAAAPPAARTQPAPRPAAPAYEVEYEGLISGVVHSVMRHEGMDVQLTLGVGETTMQILVAPMDWLDAQQFTVRPGESVEIVGARQSASAADTIVAREIRTGRQTLVLRDSEGRALWN